MGEFKHIRVAPAEDDDEVIVAGQRPSEEDVPNRSVEDGHVEYPSEPAAVGASADVPEQARGPEDGQDGQGPATAEKAKVDEAKAGETKAGEAKTGEAKAGTRRPAGKGEKGAYRATTLEDLERQPMSRTQRIVIIAAVVCIIGALLYYVLCMM